MKITHPEKVLFPDDGITKGELAEYYEAIAPVMLPHILRRPVTMERFPAGIDKPGFLQKDVSKGFPAWLERVEVPKKDGVVHHPIVTDVESLLWLANQNSITPHVWTSRAPEVYYPDICVFDLDPSIDDAKMLNAAAYAVRSKPGAPVSAPCTWAEIESGKVAPRTFTLKNALARVDRVGDLWADMRKRKRSLKRPVERLLKLGE